jgi:hypothetical protein
LTAVQRNKLVDYNEAIAACHDAHLLHLEALMNEMCGLNFLEQYWSTQRKNSSSHEEHRYHDVSFDDESIGMAKSYLGTALWLYQDCK